MRECSELHRGKLEFHPEKEGAFWSPVLVGVAQPFAAPAWKHDGALRTSSTEQPRQRETDKGAKHSVTQRSVSLKKKKKCL